MACLLERFVNRTAVQSYEDFRDNLTINVPDNFNFAFDVVDDMPSLGLKFDEHPFPNVTELEESYLNKETKDKLVKRVW